MSTHDASSFPIPIDMIPTHVVIYRYEDGDFIFVDCNAMVETTEKLSKEETIGKRLSELFPKVKEFGLFDLLLQVHKHGGTEELDLGFYQDKRISGWRRNSVSRLPNGDLIVFYEDMTEIKRHEEEYLRQKYQFEDAERIAHMGSWEWDVKTNEIRWSDEVFRIFGEEPQSFVPTYERFLSYLDEDGQVALQEAVEDALKNKHSYLFEHKVWRADGTVRYVQESGTGRFDQEGEPLSMIGTVLDITEYKEAEDQLHSLGYIVDNSLNEIYIFDVDTLKFTYVNKEAQKNTGYSLAEMKEMTPVDIKPEYTRQSFLALIRPLLEREKEELVFETCHRRKDNSKYDVEIRLQVMSVEERDQLVVIGYDISERKQHQLRLQESEEKFRKIAETALVGIFIYKEHFMYMNDTFVKMTGYTSDELKEMSPWEMVQEPDRSRIKALVGRRLLGEDFTEAYNDIKITRKNGQLRAMRVMTQTIPYKDGYAGMGMITDVTDIKEAEQKLQLLAQAMEQMDELVRITDKEGNITYVNDALVAHTGYRKMELIGKKVSIFKSGHHDKAFFKDLWDTILSGQTYRGVFVNRKKDNQIYYEEQTITPILDEDDNIRYFVGTSQDISKRIQMEEELKKLATRDSLTGIYNRYKTNEELDIEIGRANRYNSPFALAMIDIDRFKRVNDNYGHDIGDKVLCEITKVVTRYIRESDRFGRWGGEEFLLILPELDKEEALHVTEKLRMIVEEHLFEEMPSVTVSIGVSIYQLHETKTAFLKRVDGALYQAKEAGRNRVVYL